MVALYRGLELLTCNVKLQVNQGLLIELFIRLMKMFLQNFRFMYYNTFNK